MTAPLGIRQNNPGNIELNPRNKWQGILPAMPGDRFCFFVNEIWGLRAIAVTLITYYDRHGCDTVAKAIARWAPGHENPTDAYVSYVSKRMGVAANAPLNLHGYAHLMGLVKGIVTFENGSGEKHGYPAEWYPQATYDEALRRAGVLPAPEDGDEVRP